MSDFNPVASRPKAYLDYLSAEYKGIRNDERLLHLALFLHQGGDLRSLINNYRNKKSPHVTESIYDTLMMNLVYLRMGKSITELNAILSERLNESQLIDL